ncbi:unnamed protein product [Rotaria socialis]
MGSSMAPEYNVFHFQQFTSVSFLLRPTIFRHGIISQPKKLDRSTDNNYLMKFYLFINFYQCYHNRLVSSQKS